MNEVLAVLAEHELRARAAIFVECEDVRAVGEIETTSNVQTAISWRDDPGSDLPLLIFGDLERNRAAGLLNVRVLRASEVRTTLFATTIEKAQEQALPVPLVRLLTYLRDDAKADLLDCADYCSALDFAGTEMPDAARAELWRIGLLPDTTVVDLDKSRLTDNANLVAQLRSSDAATVQRLLLKISDTEDFGAVRAYARAPRNERLKNLDYEKLRAAFRSATKKPSKKKAPTQSDPAAPSLLSLTQDAAFSQDDFLKQLADLSGSQSEASQEGTITVAGSSVPWEPAPVDNFAEWLSPGGVDHYAEVAGSTVDLDAAARQTSEESIQKSQWVDLTEALRIVKTLEGRLAEPLATSAAGALEGLIESRAALLPYLAHIPHEGVRLLLASEQLLSTADGLVDTWVALWSGLGDLYAGLDSADREYVTQVGQILAASDIRIEVSGDSVSAHLLPLHPIVIEPRVAAAKVVRASSAEIDDDFVDLLISAVDPGMPGISVSVGESKRALSYSGNSNHLPVYEARPRQAEGGEVSRTVQQLIERFINVHPYTQLSLSIALVGVSPRLAKLLIKWLGVGRSERVRLDLFTSPRDIEEMQEYVDEALEELASTEADPDKFQLVVHDGDDIVSLPRRLSSEQIHPHLVVAFNVGESSPGKFTSKFVAPLQGSVITHWSFNVNPISSRPVIRPSSGSGRLMEAADKQQDLTGLGPPTQERSPLLAADVVSALTELGSRATWVALCEGASPLAAPSQVGELRLLGRLIAGTHVSYVYSSNTRMLLEPVLTYLQQSTWIHPEQSELQDFLLKTVRMALPEGLLGFFKARGALSSASVLGRLGLAAVLAYLQEEVAEEKRSLVVSLDTESARQWLNLREGPDRRADLLTLTWSGSAVSITAAEVKSRTDALKWGEGSQPDAVSEALAQVSEMTKVLRKIFRLEPEDPLTPSRREILKRQVFLEALQQWDSVRETDAAEYEARVRDLNRLFETPTDVAVQGRIFVVGTNEPEDKVARTALDGVTPVVTLGVPWLKRVLQSKAGGHIELDASLLDEFQGLVESTAAGSSADVTEAISVASKSNFSTADDDAYPQSAGSFAEANSTGAHPVESDVAGLDSSDAGGSTPPPVAHSVDEQLDEWSAKVRESLLARNAPLREIDVDRATVGPSVIQIPLRLARGARLSTLQSQEADIARELGTSGVRISNWPQEAGFACIELPRSSRYIGDVSDLRELGADVGSIRVALGAQLDFSPFVVGLDELPHLLVAGTTGSGKSVFLRSIIWQLTHAYGPAELDLVIIDAKGMADYIDFRRAPHLKSSSDYHSGVPGAVDLLAEIVDVRLPERREIFNRYAAEAIDRADPVQIANVKDMLRDAAAAGREAPLRPLVVLVDEFAELVMATADRKRFETLVTRFNQVARAIGGHLIAATQRPSTDVVTGVMKSNFARLALRVQSAVDSRVILDENGAESLMGKGDLLFKSPDRGIVRLQGYNAAGPYRF
jgi:hypothetical protein